MKQGTLYIYSNYDLGDMYDDARQYLIDEWGVNEEDEADIMPTDDEIWKEIYAQDEMNWDDTFYELKNFFKDKKVIFFGSLGLWTGRHDAGKIGDFESLFYEAVRDCDYIEFSDRDGHLELKCSHHDGTNYFEIRVLTDKGYNYAENWAYGYNKKYDYSEQEMHNRITHCSQLSRLPYYCKNVWGI